MHSPLKKVDAPTISSQAVGIGPAIPTLHGEATRPLRMNEAILEERIVYYGITPIPSEVLRHRTTL